VDAREAEKNYPLPSAFAPYASYLQIPQGSSKLKKTSAKEHEKK
jgi:hypothetical protein